jgi:hypothetical protein
MLRTGMRQQHQSRQNPTELRLTFNITALYIFPGNIFHRVSDSGALWYQKLIQPQGKG